MNKKLLLSLAVIGVSMFWSALIAEICLRFWPGRFLPLAILIFVSCVSTGLLVHLFSRRSVRVVAALESRSPRTRAKSESTRRQPNRSRRESTDGNQRRARGNAQPSDRRDRSRATEHSRRSGGRPERSSKASTQSNQSKDPQTPRYRGQIRSYSSRQAYGFIRGDDGKQAFFHKTNLDPNLDDKDLQKDLAVTYAIRDGDRGPVAIKIQLAK